MSLVVGPPGLRSFLTTSGTETRPCVYVTRVGMSYEMRGASARVAKFVRVGVGPSQLGRRTEYRASASGKARACVGGFASARLSINSEAFLP